MESVFLDIRTRSSFANASQVTRENAVKQVIMWPANADIFSPVFACLRHKKYSSGTDKLETRRRLRQLFLGGGSYMKGVGMFVRNFELNP